MTDYYILADKIKSKTAFADADIGVPSHKLIPDLIGKTEVPFNLFLRCPVKKDGKWEMSNDISHLKHLWLDFQPNTLAWAIMSEKMKSIIEKFLTGKECIVWMEIKINGNNETRIYYLPRFEKELDVLDFEKTKFVKGTNHIIIPCFSLEKIKNYGLFYKPQMFWEVAGGLYVSEQLRKAMEKEKLTGIDFERTSVA